MFQMFTEFGPCTYVHLIAPSYVAVNELHQASMAYKQLYRKIGISDIHKSIISNYTWRIEVFT